MRILAHVMRVSKDNAEGKGTFSGHESCQRSQRDIDQIKKYIYINSSGRGWVQRISGHAVSVNVFLK